MLPVMVLDAVEPEESPVGVDELFDERELGGVRGSWASIMPARSSS